MLGIGSAGAIIAVLVQGIFTGTGPIDGSLQSSISSDTTVFWAVIGQIPQYAIETLIVLSPILIIYLIVNAVWMKAARASVKRILVGSLYTYLGLVIFLTGVNTGFIGASTQVGYKLASLGSSWSLIVVGMLFGVITIPAEPSVHILTKQIEDETAGSIKALTVMITLCIGVGVAVGLSILRILIPGLMLWHILLPGMIIAIILLLSYCAGYLCRHCI